MRLLIATPLYPPELGGPATYSRILETGLPMSVTVVKFSEVRGYPKLIRHFAYFLKVFRAANTADVVLALDPVSVGFPALLAAQLRRKKFVVKIVGDYAWEQGVQRFGIKDSLDEFVRRTRVPFMVSLFRSMQTHVAKSATKVIVPSEYLKGIVSAWGVPTNRIEVIYNAIELEEGGLVPQNVLQLPHPLVVTVGRLVPWKGMKEIIDAITGTQASLVIVGDGPEREVLSAHSHEKLGDRALLSGALSHADTLAVMKAADVFVLNSTYEGLSHVLIEAMMLGTPIIATKAGGNGELMFHEKNGLLIPVQDTTSLTETLSRLLSNQSLRERLGSEAQKAKDDFSAATMRTKTAAFLHTI